MLGGNRAYKLDHNRLKGVAHRMRSAAPRRAMSFKFEHIVFYVCTHTGGVIRRLSAAPSNDSECCSNSRSATERHLHCFILNNIIFVSNRCCYESGSHSLKLHITHGLHFPSCTALTHSRPPLHQSHSCHHSLITLIASPHLHLILSLT